MLKLYNSLSRSKQKFIPLVPGHVRMYVCGMTVYDYCHLGHARVMVVFDIVARWLRVSDFKVTYIRNITDIDDKIIRRAAENGEPIEALTARFIQAMNEDAVALGVLKPDMEPCATRYVSEMQEMILELEKKKLAYVADGGDVNYSVRDFPAYGRLSGKSLVDLRAGSRVEIDRSKRDPLDFVLWKQAKSGEPSWPSPWGKGRPGWHIECSAMACALLGKQFDIHGGGQDLQFPHHENEIAQSEGAHGGTYVNYWMHNGFVRVEDEKMSKSLGNFFTVREILSRYDPEVVRFFIVRAHYRSPLNYADQHLEDAREGLSRLYTALKGREAMAAPINWNDTYALRFKAAMDDDFNTPEAVAVLFDLANHLNRTGSRDLAVLLKSLAQILGLLARDPVEFLQGRPSTTWTLRRIEDAIDARSAAKSNRDFTRADEIRRELFEAGVILEDSAQGTTWRRN